MFLTTKNNEGNIIKDKITWIILILLIGEVLGNILSAISRSNTLLEFFLFSNLDKKKKSCFDIIYFFKKSPFICKIDVVLIMN